MFFWITFTFSLYNINVSYGYKLYGNVKNNWLDWVNKGQLPSFFLMIINF